MVEPGAAEVAMLVGHFNGRRYREAAELAQSLTQRYPRHALGWKVLGAVLGQTGNVPQALGPLQKAVELSPDDADAHGNLANALRTLGKLEEAELSYRHALRIRPDFPDAHNSLGNALSALGRADEAEASYRRALEQRPGFAMAHSNLLLLLNSMPGRSAAAICKDHMEFERTCGKPRASPHPNPPDPERKLRIGYVSADFREHAAAFFLDAALEHRDRKEFEVYCYYNFPRVDDATRRLLGSVDAWHEVFSLDDDALARRIREDAIDILVDLGGHTANNRLPVFARKPAPVQATWLGYLNTTGLQAIDYRLTDPFASPSGLLDAFHSEQLLRLPDCQWCYRPPAACPDVLGLPAKASGAPTFAAFSAPVKINAQVVDLWSRLVRRVPGSRLLIVAYGLESPPSGLRDSLLAHGVPAERLTVLGSRPFQEYLSLHNAADIMLDTFPYTGGTTTCHSLWMGVPVVTLAGSTATSRGGVSLLHAVGLDELVARDQDAYLEIAASLAGDPGRLAGIRSGLRDRMRASPLMDANRFARNLESAYRGMWRTWCAKRAGGTAA
jgi:predicted O-linked N-acetylglucosamine transferase (SPINDLY family)